MSEELGSIKKPEAGDIIQNKKVYIVTLVQSQPAHQKVLKKIQ